MFAIFLDLLFIGYFCTLLILVISLILSADYNLEMGGAALNNYYNLDSHLIVLT